jgi:branched-chain amino acid transport system permease protein
MSWTLVQVAIPVWLVFLAILAFAATMGLILERVAIRPLIGQPLLSLIMMTLALSVILRGFQSLFWGGVPRKMPDFIPFQAFNIGPVHISPKHFFAFLTAVLLVALLTAFFRWTKPGLNMRAVAEDHQVAQAVGIRVRQVFSLTWIISAVLATVAGLLLSNIQSVYPELWLYGLVAFAVAILGGLDSIAGAIIGGLILGISEALAAAYLDPLVGGGMQQGFAFIILLLILIIKPYGFFGLKRIERI